MIANPPTSQNSKKVAIIHREEDVEKVANR
jgi:hypothetical protein